MRGLLRKLSAAIAAVTVGAGLIATAGVPALADSAPATPASSPSQSIRSISSQSPPKTTVSPSYEDDSPRNYVINLTQSSPTKSASAGAKSSQSALSQSSAEDPGAADATDAAKAASLAESLGATVLTRYDQFGSLFVQSTDGSFAGHFADKAKAAGIALDSVGPTRRTPVTGEENVSVQTYSLRRNNNQDGSRVTQDVSGHSLAVESVGRTAAQAAARSANRSSASQSANRSSTRSAGGSSAVQGSSEASDRNWAQRAIGVDKAVGTIARTTDDRFEVTVGVLDSGIDATHPDLKGQVDPDLSVSCQINGIANQQLAGTPSSQPPSTQYGDWQTVYAHGTHVAGLIAAAHNAIGIDGVNPKARLASVRVTNDYDWVYPEYAVCGLVWSADHHFAVANNSYGMTSWGSWWNPDDAAQTASIEVTKRAVAYAQSRDVVVVAAAHNHDTDLDNPPYAGEIQMPSMLPGVIVVSASDPVDVADVRTLARASYSNYGKHSITVTAPGSGIYSTVPSWYPYADSTGYAYLSGTSLSTPLTSGVVSLLRAEHPSYDAARIIALLKRQAGYYYGRLTKPTDGKEYRGSGLISAFAAVTRDLDSTGSSGGQNGTNGNGGNQNGNGQAGNQAGSQSGESGRPNDSTANGTVTPGAGSNGTGDTDGNADFDGIEITPAPSPERTQVDTDAGRSRSGGASALSRTGSDVAWAFGTCLLLVAFAAGAAFLRARSKRR
ncbi:peptidase S8 [Bifidobacterium margollesii]|uniref:Peptidase S8 n=1 Tax=Bifidobacterium margollesii TaxID=2020964 RepID=A0A2N5JC30_9BIFI|nr:S8 family serine peptidase [Bifidobacterium margollesii]PLS31766.1 peptidase S8 [Bifidobacterium margollesii]